ncbi:MAG: VWA domain-containing protein [Planctomycetes bacterium]|nr:VWA domain-containing protein [Planctomycetota bacterium]
MGFQHPEFLLLALPVAFAWWRLRGRELPTQCVRALVAAALVLAASAPYLRTGDAGRDLVLVVDRSRSMPSGSDATVLEVAQIAEEARRAGDRVAVVSFGGNVGIEQLPQRDARFAGFQRALDLDGSDIGSALEAGLALIPSDREGALLLVSDGEENGRDALGVARAAFARGVRIDVRPLVRGAEPDLSVERLDLPEEIGVFEPFQFGAWVRADARVEADYELERNGEVIAKGRRSFEPGANRMVFRDLLGSAGVVQYRLRLAGAGDATPENDSGVGALRVAGQRPVLVLNDDGAVDTLVQSLRKAGLPVAVATPEGTRLTRLALTGFRAVVLENVAADRVGANGMRALREFVLERGGGLLMTGGRASFGIGGWYLSPVDEVLPVSMEMRQENRKIGIALAITMDRSGSMGMEASPGVIKMQLANLGACAAIDLLSPLDAIAVVAVDSAPHVVQELTAVDDKGPITSKVRRIEVGGGGIFCYTALLAAGRQLENAAQKNRHIILFADAADSEEQEQCPELIARFREMGITVSVVALGTPQDPDAEFLRRVAAQGGGECSFTTDASELPRLFAQDTMKIARSTFIDEPAATSVLPDLFGLGEIVGLQSFPQVDGYNLTWLREDGTAGVVAQDEFRAPLFAFAHRGLGRSAAYAGQVGGEFGSRLVAWEGFSSFFVTVARWLAGQEEPRELFASAARVGREGRITVEVDPQAPTPPDLSRATVRVTGPDGTTQALALERVGEHRYEARTKLAREGVVLGSVDLGSGQMLSLPPLTLPYSPEFERGGDLGRGERLLRQIARESGGEVAPPLGTLFRGEREARIWRVVSRELLLAALVLLMLEIAARRLQLWGSAAGAMARATRSAEALVARVRPVRRRASSTKAQASAVEAPTGASEPTAGEEPRTTPAAPRVAPTPPSLDDALAKARRSARRELDR